ncbi:MAG: spore coat protein CotJB [Acidobacteriota bacterium]
MDKDQKQLLMAIMAEGFTAFDLALYLDTHPEDKKALADWNETVRKERELQAQYEKKYGPITAYGSAGEYPWRWVEEPWPWEMNFAV